MNFYSSRKLRMIGILVFVFMIGISAQNISETFWQDVNENQLDFLTERYIIPQEYRTLALDIESLKQYLANAPLEAETKVYDSRKPISLPMPDGSYQQFKLVESPIMEPALQQKFPEIRTYLGQGIDDRRAVIRFDVTPAGFHAMVLSPNGHIFIDPYSKGNSEYYISYFRKNFQPSGEKLLNRNCEVQTDADIIREMHQLLSTEYSKTTGDELRTYRLALAATGEYTAFHGGTVAAGMSGITTTMNRVNGVYEVDLAIRMVLVANNDLVVYTNAATDPYTNNSGSTMLNQNQSNLDAVIGNANYDIGHVFSTGGGGIAGLGVVCRSGLKARGVTGGPAPIGDPFDIDYVAHEMGHQYAANHTQNNNCNRVSSTAWEPGSASTIMGYAGICPPNLQNNSDPYFHVGNYDEIILYSNVGSGNTCPVITNTGNSAPSANGGVSGYALPINTPFALTGSATDPDGDPLTYCWEEFDLGPSGHPNFPSGNAPIFRSFEAVTSPTRTFPKMSDIVNNTQTLGEILPSYSRDLKFRFTVRDNRAGGGGVDYDQVAFTVTNTAGPFLVTSPNTSATVPGNSTFLVTWDVANTSSAPVNCGTVNILLSTDGGYTYPITLLAGTDNDGSEEVTIPDNQTTQARIKIEAADNVFFDISNTNFTIEEAVPVELSSFGFSIIDNSVILTWETATETNNSGFEIERSADNINYRKIAFLEGKGTSTEKSNYSYTDKSQISGTQYYRLKQIDFDGSFEYFEPILVDLGTPSEFELSQNHPNPFNPVTSIAYSIPENGVVKIKVFDAIGREVVSLVNEYKEAGKYKVEFDGSLLTSGVYYYRMESGKFAETKKLVLMK